jgi:hypothetical protein
MRDLLPLGLSAIAIKCGWTAEVPIPARGRDFFLLYNFHTGSVANLASCPMGIGGCFTGSKAAEE